MFKLAIWQRIFDLVFQSVGPYRADCDVFLISNIYNLIPGSPIMVLDSSNTRDTSFLENSNQMLLIKRYLTASSTACWSVL